MKTSHICTCKHIEIYAYIRAHMHIHVCIHIRVHINTHMHTHPFMKSEPFSEPKSFGIELFFFILLPPNIIKFSVWNKK